MERTPDSPAKPWPPSGRQALLALCRRWTRGNLAEAEDLLGDACLRVLEASAQGLPIPSPMAFWVTVINNLGRDRVRRARRWKFETGDQDSSALGSLPSRTVSADQQVFLKECLIATDRQLQRLNEKQRTAVLLRGRGLGYSGIGEALSTSPANARKLVEMARRQLNSRGMREPSRSYLIES